MASQVNTNHSTYLFDAGEAIVMIIAGSKEEAEAKVKANHTRPACVKFLNSVSPYNPLNYTYKSNIKRAYE